MNGVSTKTRHGNSSPFRRSTRRFATAEKGRSAVARFLVVLLSLFPMFAVFATNANPASADLGIPTWAKFNLPASVARTAGSVSGTVISVSEALPDVAGAIVLTATENATFDALAAGAATGAAAVTCPAWCVAAAVGIGSAGLGYGLYKFATMDGPGGCSGSTCPNSDVVASPPTDYQYQRGWHVRLTQGTSTFGYLVENNTYGMANVTVYVVCNPSASTYTYAQYSAQGQPSYGATRTDCSGNVGEFAVIANDYDGGHFEQFYLRNGGGRDPYPLAGNAPQITGSGATSSAPTATAGGSGGGTDINRVPVETRVCKDTAGNATTVTATGTVYKESWGRALVKHAACPAGTVTDSATVISHAPNGEAPDKQLSTITRPATVPVGTTPGQVTLIIKMPDGSTQTCEQTPSPCANWFDNPTKQDTYQCMQGATVLPLSDCDGLQKRYNAPPVAVPADGQDTSCWSGFSFNPVSWVITPLKCLFIPKGDAMGRWKAQISAIQNSGVIALFTTFGNFVGTVATAGKTATACPTESAGTFHTGHSVVTKTSPIHWCDIIQNAGNQTQSTTWGLVIYNGARIMLFIWFGIYWYNRIAASAGSQSAL